MKRHQPGRSRKDAAEVVRETARLPDRDQMFETGNKTIPPVVEDRDGWAGDDEARIENRGDQRDAVDALRTVDRIADRHERTPSRDARPTSAPRADESGPFTDLSDDELRKRAEVLGIAGRQAMSRAQLARAMLESGSPT